MRVAARALSVFCPHCQKRATLEDLRIVGSHPGRLLATCGNILIERTAILNLEVSGNNVVVRGRVCGSVSANETVEIGPTGRVIGDVRAAKIVVRDGGVIQGLCEVVTQGPILGVAAGRSVQGRAAEPSQAAFAGGSTASSTESPRPFSQPPVRQIRPIQLD